MKLSILSLVASSLVLSGCTSTVGMTPQDAQHTNAHGVYWHQDAKDSLAKNSYSLSGVDVKFADAELAPGSSDEAGISKYLINGSMGYITGGLSGLSIMSLSSLYSKDDAERIILEQFVVFVPNKLNLPYNDPTLIKDGARYVFDFVKDSSSKRGFNSLKQIAAVDNCNINEAVMAKFSSCDLPTPPTKDVSFDSRLFEYQVIRPATGTEIPELKLNKGSYSVIRYSMIVTAMDASSKGFSGLILRPDNPKLSPRMYSVSVSGSDYYLFSGANGRKGFPEKKLVSTW